MEDNELNKYSNRLDGENYAKLKERMEYVLSDEAFEDMVQNALKNIKGDKKQE